MTPESFQRLRILADGMNPIVDLFRVEPRRAQQFTFDAAGIHADFSRQLVSEELWSALVGVAHGENIVGKISALFAGEKLNVTEGRAALHTALRADPQSSEEAMWATQEMNRMLQVAEKIRGDSSVNAVVNIGIGGSHLGPAMVTRGLRHLHDGPIVRFVSNVDGADFESATHDLDPRTTVFVVCSKTMTTSETLHNAERAKHWVESSGAPWSQRFYAVTASPDVAVAAGYAPEHCFSFAEWVGGRFSVSSVIGCAVACAIGADNFSEFLLGMRAMDEHFRTADIERNLPVAHALTWFAHSALHNLQSIAVVPYVSDLVLLPAYLQQLCMESNGKSVDSSGMPVLSGSGPIVWGTPGTDGQHAYFQYLHQGATRIPVEFISTVSPLSSDHEAHEILIANMIAQSEALTVGSSHADPHREFTGNRPSSVLFLQDLSARSLGALVALYEHSTVVQGWMLGVNSFDQFGVELGKTLARTIHDHIRGDVIAHSETVTHPLLEWFLREKKNNHSL